MNRNSGSDYATNVYIDGASITIKDGVVHKHGGHGVYWGPNHPK